MLNNIFLGITFLIYIFLIIFNFDKGKGNGDQMVGYLYIGFVIIAAYILLSIILTICVNINGGFYWISNSSIIRNIGAGLLCLCMMAGVVVCTMMRTELIFGDKLNGLEGIFATLIYYGAVWLPLLMLLAYASLLNPEWKFSFTSNWSKVILIIAGIIGLLLFITQSKVRSWISLKSESFEINSTINKINSEKSISLALYYLRDDDKQLQLAAINRIKKQKNYEDKFFEIFENKLITSIDNIFLFWEKNKINQADRFVGPINNVFPQIISEFEEAIVNPYKSRWPLNVEVLCHVFEEQFKESSSAFKTNMLKLQEVLTKEPVNREGVDSKLFKETIIKYKLAVQEWLGHH